MLENIYTTKMSANKKQLQNRFTKIRSKSGRISKIMSCVMAVLVAVTMLCATVVMAALDNEESKELITLYAKGEMITLKNKPFIQNNMTYFPLRETFEKLGVFKIEGNELTWDNGTIYIRVTENEQREPVSYIIKINSDTIDISHNRNTRLAVVNDEKPVMGLKLIMPEETPLLIGNKTYVPYTYLRYMLHNGLGLTNKNEAFDFMFTINGETPSAFILQGFTWPCDGEMPISSRYGTRTHPITGDVIKHNGIDIVAPEGTDVNSAMYGTVSEAGYNAEKGYFVIIERDNVQTVYASLTQDIQVKKGDTVLRGQTIGKVGKTGTSTGAHLHFEVLINGEYYDPELIN